MHMRYVSNGSPPRQLITHKIDSVTLVLTPYMEAQITGCSVLTAINCSPNDLLKQRRSRLGVAEAGAGGEAGEGVE